MLNTHLDENSIINIKHYYYTNTHHFAKIPESHPSGKSIERCRSPGAGPDNGTPVWMGWAGGGMGSGVGLQRDGIPKSAFCERTESRQAFAKMSATCLGD